MSPFALASLFVSTAWPCGGLFHDLGELAHSDEQMALFDRTVADQTTVSYAVNYKGDATSFGWVIPIPGAFQSLIDGDLADFSALLDQTNPLLYEQVVDDGGCGYSATSKGLAGGGMDTGASRGEVTIVASGISATYTFTVLEATSEDALLSWLSDNGWDVAESEPSIAAYVADGIWQFVAIGLVPTGSGSRGMLPPVNITYSGERAIYPARMVRYAMVDELHTIIWVRASTPTAVSDGWTQAEVGELAGELGADASAIYANRLRLLGGDRPGYGLVYSQAEGDGWLTRFDALTEKEANTADATFSASDDTTPVRATITLSEEGEATHEAALLAVPLLVAGWGLRRRR